MQLFQKIFRKGDAAVTYSFFLKLLQFVLGPLVLLAVTTQMTAVEQGFYFVFLSLLRLKGFVDLGLAQTSSQILAFSFSKLNYSRDEGLTGKGESLTEFLATSQFLSTFFKYLSLVFLVVVGGGGFLFLSRQETPENLSWQGPWLLLIVASTLNFSMVTGSLVSRGCNLMARVTAVDFWVQLFGLVLFLTVLFIGGGLWASAAMMVSQTFGLIVLNFKLGSPFRQQMRSADRKAFSYKEKLLPLQLKNGVTFASGFLIFYSFTPLVMEFNGPVAAGRVGMNIQIVNMVHGFAVIWMTTKIPKMGNLAGSGEIASLVRLYRRGVWISLISWLFFVVGAIIVFLGISHLDLPLGERMGSLGELLLWLSGGLGFLWCFLRGSFVRAFCVEPFAKLNLIRAIGTVTFLAIALPLWGQIGAGMAYLLSMGVGAFFFEQIFRRYWVADERLFST